MAVQVQPCRAERKGALAVRGVVKALLMGGYAILMDTDSMGFNSATPDSLYSQGVEILA